MGYDSKDLQIELAAPPRWRYAAGDTVIGHVTRSAHIVSPDACVKLTLIGRLKTKFYKERSLLKGSQKFCSRWHLWTPEPKILFHGPLHLPKTKPATQRACWEFSVAIPLSPDPSIADGHSQEESFLSLNAKSVENQPLPGSYRSRYDGLGTSYETFVEYYLEAELSYISRGTRKSVRASHLIILNHPVASISNRGDFTRQYKIGTALHNGRLRSDSREKSATLGKNQQRLFGLRNPANGVYIVEVSSPRVIQLNDPVPFAFMIKIFPEIDPFNTVLKSGPAKTRLNSVNLSLQTQAQFCATSVSGPQSSDHYFVQDFELGKEFRRSKDVPILSNQSKYYEVDIGSIFQLSLAPGGLYVGGRLHRTSPEIYPDFVTYNVKHANSLLWKISITVAEKTYVLQDCSPLTILAPS